MTHPPTLRQPNEGQTVAIVGDVYRFMATGDDTDGRYAMFEAVVRPGGGPPPHIHSREEESFYVLEGEITFFSASVNIHTRTRQVEQPPALLTFFTIAPNSSR